MNKPGCRLSGPAAKFAGDVLVPDRVAKCLLAGKARVATRLLAGSAKDTRCFLAEIASVARCLINISS